MRFLRRPAAFKRFSRGSRRQKGIAGFRLTGGGRVGKRVLRSPFTPLPVIRCPALVGEEWFRPAPPNPPTRGDYTTESVYLLLHCGVESGWSQLPTEQHSAHSLAPSHPGPSCLPVPPPAALRGSPEAGSPGFQGPQL